MLKAFLPHQEKFFLLFGESSKELVKAASAFNALLHDLPNSTFHSRIVSSHEKEADKIANATFAYLHSTFITPFDHYDIQQIVIKLDDILDAIHGAAQRITLYQLHTLPPEIVTLGGVSIQLAELLDKSINLLSSLKNSKVILSNCSEIAQIKSAAKYTLTSGIAHLFQAENDIKQLLKVKDIYECAKLIVDSYEDFAHVLKSIILEYS